MKNRISISLVALAACSTLAAQQGSLAGPVTGFVYDAPARAVRPIQGIPGAALIGDPVSFGLDVHGAYVSPHQDAAFVSAADGSLHFFRLTSAGPVETGIGGVNFVPQGVVFSPSGSAAALFAAGRVQVFRGLPNAPALAASMTLPASGGMQAAPAGRARSNGTAIPAFAISDDGQYLITAGGQLLSVNGDAHSVAAAGAGTMVAFAPGGHDVALLDPANGLTVIRDASGAGTLQKVAPADDTLTSSAGLAFSQDGAKLFVASASTQSVISFDLAAGTRATIACNCTPTTLAPMGSLFRITELTGDPLWLVDAVASRTVFVPAKTN